MLLLALAACSDYEFTPIIEPVLTECSGDLPPAPVVAPLDECASAPAVGTFVPEVEWAWSANPLSPGYEQIMAAPVVGDVDGDGVPDVVFTAFAGGAYTSPGALVALSGADGSTLWSVTDIGGHAPFASSGVAIADLSGAGDVAVIVSTTDGLAAVDGSGAFLWYAAVPAVGYGHPAVGDLEGDGSPEIVYGATAIRADGTIAWTGAGGTGSWSYMSFPVDLDGDGRQEVVAGNTVYESDGAVRWSDGGPDGFPAVADLDLDGEPEIVRVGGGVIRASRADGTLMWDFPITDGGGGPPTIADFDGDGAPEIGVASRSVYRVVEAEGTERWSAVVQDYSSSVTGSAVFDFEGDGGAEVVYADEQTLWVYDGATGAVEMAWDSHASGTLYEYPLVVDVDADGATEIVVASNNYAFAGSTGITVIGDAAGSWAPGRTIWNQHAYFIANVTDSGAIPRVYESPWLSWNSFRAGNSETAVGYDQPDLEIGEPEICADECHTLTSLAWFPVSNRGVVRVERASVVATSGGETVDGMDVRDLAPGETRWVGPLRIPDSAFADGGVLIRVDAGDEIVECDESNNRVRIEASPCSVSP